MEISDKEDGFEHAAVIECCNVQKAWEVKESESSGKRWQ